MMDWFRRIRCAPTRRRRDGAGAPAGPQTPVPVSAQIEGSGNLLHVTFNVAVTGTYNSESGDPAIGFGLDMSLGMTLSYSAGLESTVLSFAFNRTVAQGEEATLSYNPGDVAAVDGAALLASFSGFAVTNNSTQEAIPEDFALSGEGNSGTHTFPRTGTYLVVVQGAGQAGGAGPDTANTEETGGTAGGGGGSAYGIGVFNIGDEVACDITSGVATVNDALRSRLVSAGPGEFNPLGGFGSTLGTWETGSNGYAGNDGGTGTAGFGGNGGSGVSPYTGFDGGPGGSGGGFASGGASGSFPGGGGGGGGPGEGGTGGGDKGDALITIRWVG